MKSSKRLLSLLVGVVNLLSNVSAKDKIVTRNSVVRGRTKSFACWKRTVPNYGINTKTSNLGFSISNNKNLLSNASAKDKIVTRNSVVRGRTKSFACWRRTVPNYGINTKTSNLGLVSNNKKKFQNITNCFSFGDVKKLIRNNPKVAIGTGTLLVSIPAGVGINKINKFLNSPTGIYFTSSNDSKFKQQQTGVQNMGIECRKRFITGSKYVFKIISGSNKSKEIVNSEILACKILKNCKDKRIKAPKNYRINTDGNYVFIYEFADGMSLEDYAKTLKTNKEKYMALFKIVKQLLEIHVKLHSLGIQHDDMHTGNFFVKTEKNEPIVQLFDFGECKKVKHKDSVILPIRFFDFVRDIERTLFGCGPYVSTSGLPTNYCNIILELPNYGMFELLKQIFEDMGSTTINYFEANSVSFRNYFFGKLLSKNAFEVNPSFPYNGITDEEVSDIYNGKELDYKNVDIEKLINFLDRKIHEFDTMSDDEINEICPVVKIDVNNVDDYIKKNEGVRYYWSKKN